VSDPLYRRELLRLAADAHGAGRLPLPTATGAAFNPACGDRVTVDLTVADDRVVTIAHDTKACVLAQASASILGAHLAGRTRSDVSALRNSIVGMLAGGAAVPDAPFDLYRVFDGVADHPGRHRCVLLPIEAVLDAFENGKSSEPRSEGRQR
jgi:NifU-like protein involved in Fe-S cluster formation